MEKAVIEGVYLTPIAIIPNSKGDILHALKKSEASYEGFGEAYFSRINFNEIKGWKLHKEMTLNLIVPYGNVKFVISEDKDNFFETQVGEDNYQRLTIKPGVFFAFQGLSKYNLIMNIASVEHNDSESITSPLEYLKYDWCK